MLDNANHTGKLKLPYRTLFVSQMVVQDTSHSNGPHVEIRLYKQKELFCNDTLFHIDEPEPHTKLP